MILVCTFYHRYCFIHVYTDVLVMMTQCIWSVQISGQSSSLCWRRDRVQEATVLYHYVSFIIRHCLFLLCAPFLVCMTIRARSYSAQLCRMPANE